MARPLMHLNMLGIGAMLAMGNELRRLPQPEPTPDGKPRVRRGFGTQRCAQSDCNRTISANKAWCVAHRPGSETASASAAPDSAGQPENRGSGEGGLE